MNRGSVLKRGRKIVHQWWFKKHLQYRQRLRYILRQPPQNLWEQLLWVHFKYPKQVTIIVYAICSTVVMFSAFYQYVMALH